jgi:prolipoprotein diacylglyceryltransferase
MAYLFAKFWRHRPGITFFSGLVLYSAMRFGVSYLRIDSGVNCPAISGCPDHIIKNWMTFPQVVSMCLWAIGMVGLAWSVWRKPQPEPSMRTIATEPSKQKVASSRYTS